MSTEAPPAARAAAAAEPALAAEGLTVGYRRRRRSHRVLADLELAVRPGRVTCLLGPNGSGKTTLLRTLAGSLPPLAGRVRVDGRDIRRLSPADRARRLAVVLTGGVDAGLLRAHDLVALGRHPHSGWSGRLGPDDHRAVDWALRVTDAAALADRRIDELSDGERQRVLIARALAQEPRALLLDEPTAFVDLPRRVELAVLLDHLARECGLAVLLSSHDLDLALRGADEVWLVDAGDPGAVEVGGPEDLALNGAVDRVLGSPAARFDTGTGRFTTTGPALATAAVRADGAAALWAARALERAGYRVADHGEVTARRAGERWELLVEGRAPRRHASLAALAEDARALLPTLAG